jgi:micrococcal nuclease
MFVAYRLCENTKAMNRKLHWLLTVLLLACMHLAQAQQPRKVPRIGLLSIGAPETVHPKNAVEAFGKEASAFTKRIVEGKLVRLEFDPLASRGSDGKDRYSRTLAYVFLQDGTHLNAEIIRQGYGFAVTGSPPLKYQNEFRRLELEAREQRRGLWASH